MNYATLVAAIESTTVNTFETADMDRFIRLAEQRIYQSGYLPVLRKTATGALTPASQYYTVPTDFLSAFDVSLTVAGTTTFLLNKNPDFIREAYPTAATTGTPVHYAMFDETRLILGPTPTSNYSIEIHYFGVPESIVTAATTWLGTNFESVLLNACVLEAHKFMKAEEATLVLWTDAYKQSLILLKNLGDGKLQQDTYRSGAVRTQVI